MTSRGRRSLLLAGAATGAFLMVLGISPTASAATYYDVAPGVQLNVRRGPGTQYAIVRQLPVGAKVAIYCQTPGETVTGTYGTSNIWDNISSGEYIADAYVKTGTDGYIRPRCA
ncbi:SH3 domain-containing protein [Streptomyces cinnabarinus]|uniref:SH3 domain-containing protein n=1 Tax=Streptomyces cinnabarinus TaxID=67287 RepID=A0ABY7KIP9_9ACTN|nr:SH3 domain-containing protein [Streptomyces cinnabarinus]WAZ23262.1 SH3 domain-containing protein [Streptomyces cinnabarinus]